MKKTMPMVALAAIAASCSGSTSSDTEERALPSAEQPSEPAPAGAGDIVSEGVITGFGSVFVNGKKFEVLDETLVVIEGEAGVGGGQSLLKLGQKVKVEATALDDGTYEAEAITFDEDLRGPAVQVTPDPVDPGLGTFRVVGQVVTVDGTTIFGDDFADQNADGLIDIRDLDRAQGVLFVEVSGQVGTDGVTATRIDPVDADALGREDRDGDEIEVKGFVDEVLGGGTAIVINGTQFSIPAGTEFDEGLAADDSLLGEFVEVKADIDDQGGYVATEIERGAERDEGEEGEEFEIEGRLTAVSLDTEPQTITVAGLTIEVDDASAFETLVGETVEIEGVYDAEGVLALSEFEVERENIIDLRDEVAGIDQAAGTFTTRLGITIEPNGGSRTLDLKSPRGGPLGTPEQFLSSLAVMDDITARGYVGEDGSVVWTLIKREPVEREGCVLKAYAGDGIVAGTSFELLGVSVETAGLTGEDAFEDADGAPLDSAAFYSRLEAGDLVRARSGRDDTACSEGSIVLGEGGSVSFGEDGDEGESGAEDPDGEEETEEEG